VGGGGPALQKLVGGVGVPPGLGGGTTPPWPAVGRNGFHAGCPQEMMPFVMEERGVPPPLRERGGGRGAGRINEWGTLPLRIFLGRAGL
jgi:hypothetical protein